MPALQQRQSSTRWPSADGEIAARIRRFDWGATSLGPTHTWPSTLRTIVDLALASRAPLLILWGSDLIQIPNDAFASLLSTTRIDCLGHPYVDCWPLTWSEHAREFSQVMSGATTEGPSVSLVLRRDDREGEIAITTSFSPVCDESGEVAGVLGVTSDSTECLRLQRTLRDIDARHSFLLDLNAALRTWSDPIEIQEVAARTLGKHLRADRVLYAELHSDAKERHYVIERDYTSASTASIAGRHSLSSWEAVARELTRGDTVAVDDIATDSRFFQAAKRSSLPAGLRAFVAVPLVRDGTLTAVLGVHQNQPRAWTKHELALVEETAERTWESVWRRRVESVLRESEERQSFLLKLSDAIRPLEDPIAVQEVATRLLGEHMHVDRVGFSELESNEEWMCVARDWHAPGAPSVVGRYRMDEFGKFFTRPLREGGFSVIEDAFTDPRVARATYTETWGAVYTRAAICYAVAKGGRLCACLFVHASAPRKWTDEEVKLVSDVSERTWEAVLRARSEAALRVSETRFRQFGNASSDAVWIRDAETLAMEYASPAVQTIYGVAPETILGDPKHWGALIVPEDRDAAFANLERARSGPIAHEFRVRRAHDGVFRWLRSTDFPLFDDQGHLQRVAGITSDVTEARQWTEHQSVLLSELQHRVRNIMAMIRSITARTSERAQSVAEYAALIGGRLLALARVQTLLTRGATNGVNIATLIRDEVDAQAEHEDQYEISGPDVAISPKAAEVLTLAVHELSTNALKYGALSVAQGRVSVSWNIQPKRGKSWLALKWLERGAPQAAHTPTMPQRRGFGIELIEGLIPYELGGVGRLTFAADGVQCFLEFPIKEGSSILETDAPKRATIFGGALDMSGQTNLTGQRILVVEDDYYLATDTARAIQGAGADVMGPCPNEEAALDKMNTTIPTGAVLDLNLGNGPSFELAKTLMERNVPFVLITGYDAKMIPEEFQDIARLQKPVTLKQIVNTLGEVLAR